MRFKQARLRWGAHALGAAIALGLCATSAMAQDEDEVAPGAGQAIEGTAAGPQGDSWASIGKLPDLTTGIWLGMMPGPPTGAKGAPPAGTAAPIVDGRDCAPNSMPDIMGGPLAIEFWFAPKRVMIALETEHAVRRIYLQPRHSADPDYAYMGESIAHWENGTLVIDTIAIKSKHGKPPARVVERMHLAKQNLLEVDRTIYDGGKSSDQKIFYQRRPDERITEYYCEDNPRDDFDKSGHINVDTSQQ